MPLLHVSHVQNTGTSLLEAFNAEQIRAHLHLIRTMAEAQRATQVPPLLPSDSCKVCQLTKLSFEPPVIYCSLCGLKIKRGQTFYSTPADASNDLKVGKGNYSLPGGLWLVRSAAEDACAP